MEDKLNLSCKTDRFLFFLELTTGRFLYELELNTHNIDSVYMFYM